MPSPFLCNDGAAEDVPTRRTPMAPTRDRSANDDPASLPTAPWAARTLMPAHHRALLLAAFASPELRGLGVAADAAAAADAAELDAVTGAFTATAFKPGDELRAPRGRLLVVAAGCLRRGDGRATLGAGDHARREMRLRKHFFSDRAGAALHTATAPEAHSRC